MPFAPRAPDEIRQSLIGYLVSTGVLAAVHQGDVAATLLAAYADDMAGFELALKEWVDFYFLNVRGPDLDDRVAQIPGLAPRSRGWAAYGEVKAWRLDTTTSRVFPPGSLAIANRDVPDVVYVNTTEVFFDVGVDELTNLPFRCTTLGSRGNAPARTIANVVRGEGVDFALNTTAFTDGLDYETDDNLRQRAVRYMNALARSQAEAIRAIAENWEDSTGMRVRHVKAFEFADTQRGYTELVVARGNGMPGSVRPAQSTTGIFPNLVSGTRHTLYFDAPAASTPRVRIGGTDFLATNAAFATNLEAGTIIVQGTLPGIAPGVAWEIYGHNVFQGWIAEFQDFCNRTCVAAGTRVRVMPAEVQTVNISANCVVSSSRSTVAVFDQVRRVIVDFFDNLGIGEPCFIHKLHAQVARVPGVINIIFDQADLVPGSQRSKLVTNLSNIVLR